MLIIYRFLTIFFYPILILIIYLRKILNKEHAVRYKEKIFPSKFNVKKEKDKKLIWFHAASVGEVKSILPIINSLSNKKFSILITTVTLSSGNLIFDEIKKYRNVYHRYFPIDVSFIMNEFLLHWSPDAIFLVDSEIWPNLITLIKQKKIPLAILNARITKKTFKRWCLVPKTAKKIFGSFDLCLTSNNETKDYLRELNAKKIFFHGNIKFINILGLRKMNETSESLLSQSRFWLASSTHNSEEIFCLKTHKKLKEKYKDLITIIAPRHLDRVNSIKDISESMGLTTGIINKSDLITNKKEVFIINYFGSLPKYFQYAKSVFIGKSTIKKLKSVGGQNPIEAASMGCKIYHGPYVYNFKEIYEFLENKKISKKINNYEELAENLYIDLRKTKKDNNNFFPIIDEISRKVFNLTMKDINKFLSNESI